MSTHQKSGTKFVKLNRIVGFSGIHNSRDSVEALTSHGYVWFRNELRQDTSLENGGEPISDDRRVVYDVVFGDDTKEKMKLLKLLRDYDKNPPTEAEKRDKNAQLEYQAKMADFLSLAADLKKNGQRSPVNVEEIQWDDGKHAYFLQGGSRRFMALAYNALEDGEDPNNVEIEIKIEKFDEGKTDLDRMIGSYKLNALHKKPNPVEEGAIYHQMHQAGYKDKEIAEELSVLDKLGKLNMQRVRMYRLLWDDRVNQKTRTEVANGNLSLVKVVRSLEQKKDKDGTKRPGRKPSADKPMPTKAMLVALEDKDTFTRYVEAAPILPKIKNRHDFEEGVRYALTLGVGKFKPVFETEAVTK